MSADPVPGSIAVNKYIYEGRAFTVLHLRSAVGFKQQIQIIERNSNRHAVFKLYRVI